MTSTVNATDAANSGAAVPIMLTELRLPTIKRLWAEVAAPVNTGLLFPNSAGVNFPTL